MSWIREKEGAYEHEGGIVGVLADGTVPTYPIGSRSRQRPWHGGWGGESRETVPDEPPAKPRPVCVCWWNGVGLPIDAPPEGAETWRNLEAPLRAQWESWGEASRRATLSAAPSIMGG